MSRRRRPKTAGAAGAAVAAGVAGLTSMLAFAPFAHAAPSSPAAPQPSGSTAGAATAARQAKADASAAPTSSVAPVTPDFGLQKYRVGVQVKSGAYVPAGTTTVGTQLTITETGPSIQSGSQTTTCTTDASTVTPGSTATYCLGNIPLDRQRALRAAASGRLAAVANHVAPLLTTRPSPVDAPQNEFFLALPGDTVTITQKTVEPNLLTDPATATVAPCVAESNNICFGNSNNNTLLATDEIFDDPGLPPVAVDDTATVLSGASVVVDPLANDTTHGAPTTSLSISAKPSHGSATVVAGTIRYTSTAPFVGVDHFRYSFSTANGTASALVTVTVLAPPPTAVDDSATTTSGTAVTIAVLGNDDAHGGGALRVSAIGSPSHGTVALTGSSAVYTPQRTFTGTDTFTYVAATAYGTDTATVTVTVNASAALGVTGTRGTTPVLAETGADDGWLVAIGASMLLVGGTATVAGRRRHRAGHPLAG